LPHPPRMAVTSSVRPASRGRFGRMSRESRTFPNQSRKRPREGLRLA
jgi:hypothetical protein